MIKICICIWDIQIKKKKKKFEFIWKLVDLRRRQLDQNHEVWMSNSPSKSRSITMLTCIIFILKLTETKCLCSLLAIARKAAQPDQQPKTMYLASKRANELCRIRPETWIKANGAHLDFMLDLRFNLPDVFLYSVKSSALIFDTTEKFWICQRALWVQYVW